MQSIVSMQDSFHNKLHHLQQGMQTTGFVLGMPNYLLKGHYKIIINKTCPSPIQEMSCFFKVIYSESFGSPPAVASSTEI